MSRALRFLSHDATVSPETIFSPRGEVDFDGCSLYPRKRKLWNSE
jgi:hypothetical protein